MSEATVIENVIAEGWYEDPAKPDMQRWWTGSAWTDHVRYAEKKRLRPIGLAPLPFTDERFAVAPLPETIADERPLAEERPFYSTGPVVVAVPPVVAEAPVVVEAPVVAERPFYEERPVLSIVDGPRFELPSTPTAVVAPLDNYYVPMARFQPHPIENTQILPQRRWGRVIAIWIFAVAAIGVSAGAALWVFLPR